MEQAIDALQRWRSNIHLISQLIQNDVSSTKVSRFFLGVIIMTKVFFFQVRLFLRRGLSIRYLLPNPVVDYIEQNGLYQDETTSAVPNLDKGKGKERDPAARCSNKELTVQS